jgi:glycine cleavage system aminomethyltransferase T
VARIDARGGNVPRHLRGIIVDSEVIPDIGAKLIARNGAGNSKPLGTVSSVSFSPGFKAPVALAMVRRDVMVPAEATVITDDGPVPCRILELPLVPPS